MRDYAKEGVLVGTGCDYEHGVDFGYKYNDLNAPPSRVCTNDGHEYELHVKRYVR